MGLRTQNRQPAGTWEVRELAECVGRRTGIPYLIPFCFTPDLSQGGRVPGGSEREGCACWAHLEPSLKQLWAPR